MNRNIKLATFALATVLFAGVLSNASPVKTFAYDEFIVDLHNETFLKVESGHDFTVVLSTNNEVFTFGRNDRGQLGNGNTDTTLSVFNITESFNLNPGETIVDIDAGWGFTVASTSANRIFAWGDQDVVQLAKGVNSAEPQTTPFDLTSALNPSNAVVRKISAGDSNIMVWTNTNVVRMAGGNNFGQLGQGNTTSNSGAVSVIWGSLLSGQSLKDVGIFAQTAYALTESGTVFTWGNNTNKQVGNGGANAVTLPAQLTFPGLAGGEKVVSVSVGVNHGVAVTSAYKVYFWGTNFNSAVGDSTTLPVNTVKNTPFNATAGFIYENEDYLGGFATNYYRSYDETETYEDETYRPLEVYAGNDATIFKVENIERYYENNIPGPYEDPYVFYWVIGLNSFENQSYVLTDYNVEIIVELEYAYWQTYNDFDTLIDFGFSRTNSIWLNEEGDFTIHGSNVYGQHGFGSSTDGGDYSNTNYSYNVRYFIDNVYNYLPTNLTAPLEDYFYPVGGMTPTLANEYDAIFGKYNNNDYRTRPGILDYFFPESYSTGYSFNEKEWALFSSSELTFMRQIIATLFENEVLYESYIKSDDLILDELDYYGREAASWIRYDMDFYASYGSYDMAWDDAVYLDDETTSLVSNAVETRLDYYRELLAAVEGFEDTYLQPFLAAMLELTEEFDGEFSFTYYDNYYGEFALDLGYAQIEYLIENDYQDDILAIFDAYDALPELVQLLINEWNFYGIYEELYYAYYYYFADAYSDELYDFMDDIQDDYWDWYYPLFVNLDELQALLEKINSLPQLSFTWFTDTYVDYWGEEYYDYYSYEYWLHLNELLPLLIEGKPVFDQIVIIEDFVQYDDDEYDYYVNVEDAAAIIAMFNDFLALSEEAQELLNPEYVYWLYDLALTALANDVASRLYSIADEEYENGYYGLFANYDDVIAALTAFEALPEDALEYLDEDTIAYYYYLLDLKEALSDGLEVYGQIIDIEDLIQYDEDTESFYVNLDDAQSILDMYANYLLLSEEAQELLYPEYVYFIYDLALQALANNVNAMVATIEDGEVIDINDLQAVLDAIAAYNALPEDAKEYAEEAYQRLLGLLNVIRQSVENTVDALPSLEEFADLYNNPDTREQAVNDLLAAKEAYDALTDEQKEDFDPELKAKLDALLSLYAELQRPDVDFGMIFLILVHLSAGAYFAFKKRDTLISVGNFKND
jgi:hypothetical protein